MSFTYYNQYSYKNTPYWCAAKPSATIATSGCGVCCASMVLSAFGITVKPPEMAKIAMSCGARVNTGTDMGILSAKLKSQYGLILGKYSDIASLKRTIKAGGVAIANVGGDRTGYKGVFSNAGHYVAVYGTKDDKPIIYDPGWYQNKYDSSYRASKVARGEISGQLLTSWNILDQDCANRSPKYYVFTREEKALTVEEAKSIIRKKAGLSDATMIYLWSYRYGDDLLIKLAQAMKEG